MNQRPQTSGFKPSGERGFSLMELVIVMTILAILAAVAAPIYNTHVKHAKEVTLKQQLDGLRRSIDNYTVDKQRAPQSLQDLVSAGYLRQIPIDPITKSADTWLTEQESEPFSPDVPIGIREVRSGAEGADTDGKPFSEY
jgi:general secretion pathway protein G